MTTKEHALKLAAELAARIGHAAVIVRDRQGPLLICDGWKEAPEGMRIVMTVSVTGTLRSSSEWADIPDTEHYERP